MIQGTMSNSGKTFVTAGLCRIFHQDGFKTAPFKSQNMALNSFITSEGLEIGRAQAMQAEAACIEPTTDMNPILLKPTTHMGSQVIVNGEVFANMSAVDYYKRKKIFRTEVLKAFEKLSKSNDIIVIEGAGSPAEINLKQDDIVNMGMAKMANANVFLVADIDRGGVFASVYGTLALLEPEEREMVKGIIINKFRGDVKILEPGLKMLEDLTGIPVIGVVPMGDIDIDDEDSLSERLNQKIAGEGIDIAVIRLPHISNFTDFHVFSLMDYVSIRYVTKKEELKTPDLILIPGTKNTIHDLLWLRESGLEGAIQRLAGQVEIIGICGGFQMLGEELHDPYGVETGKDVRGMGLLHTATTFLPQKTRTRISGQFIKEKLPANLSDPIISGYEIHMGKTINLGCAEKMIVLEDGRIDAYSDQTGMIWGTYLHGIFDNEAFAYALIGKLMKLKGIKPEKGQSFADYKEEQYNKLADLIRNSLDMKKIYAALEKTTDVKKEKVLKTKGLIHVYCGDGKGKTTAAMGLAVRAAGSGKRVLVYQFMKDNRTSEINSLERLPNITRVQGPNQIQFSFQMTAQEKEDAYAFNNKKLEEIFTLSKSFDLLILDESLYAVGAGILSEKILLNYLTSKKDNLEVVLTGRNPSEEILKIADYVTEMKKIKHPFDKGMKSRRGIEC